MKQTSIHSVSLSDKRSLPLQTILCFLILILALSFLIFSLNQKIDTLINADDASELVLGRLLAKENSLISKNWYYSTELRVLNTQVFYALFSKITDNWHSVRMLSYVCLYLVLLVSYYFLCKAIDCQKLFPVSAVLLVLPFSPDYFEFVLQAVYYIPHIVISFLTIYLMEKSLKKRNAVAARVFLFLLAVLAGMGGPRQILLLYIPMLLCACFLFLSACIRNSKSVPDIGLKDFFKAAGPESTRYMVSSLVSFFGAGIGYFLNITVLSSIYSFQSWDTLHFKEFDFSMLGGILNGFLSNFGFTTGNVFEVSPLLSNCVCVFLLVTSIVSIAFLIRHREQNPKAYRLAVLYITSVIVFTLLYLFTDTLYKYRYSLPIIVLFIPLLAAYIKDVRIHIFFKRILVIIFFVVVGLSSLNNYRQRYAIDRTSEYREIVSVLKDGGYLEGHASFWNANILTELSNGEVEVWVFNSANNILDTCKWLQAKEHDTSHPKGKVFLLLSESQLSNNDWKGGIKDTDTVLYHSNAFTVFGFSDYDTLVKEATP